MNDQRKRSRRVPPGDALPPRPRPQPDEARKPSAPDSPRAIAAQVVERVLDDGILFSELLPTHEGFVKLSPVDRRLTYHLAAGTIKYKRRLDHIARHFLQGKFETLPKNILATLRVGLFQLSVSDKIPPYAAVNETVKAARLVGHQGTASLVNAVLRKFQDGRGGPVQFPSREKNLKKFLGAWHSYPGWLIDLFLTLGDEGQAESFCLWGNRDPEFFFRANPLMGGERDLLERARRENIEFEPFEPVPGYYRWRGKEGPSAESALLRSGYGSIQNPAAGLVVKLLDPQPKESIADLFAAPGGKACAIAEQQRDTGHVLAIDKSIRRMQKIVENKGRLKLVSVLPISGDALALEPHETDRVLADVPCSALGTLPKNPDARWQKTPEGIARLATEQSAYLQAAAAQVRPGGVLVYATCTITPQENHQVVAKFLSANPDYVLEPADKFVGKDFTDDDGFLVTYPPRRGLDCVFGARLKRKT